MRHVPHLRLAAFVGRETELALLASVLPSRHGSRAGAVAVIGEAGIGKTRLADAVVAAARARGIRVVRGVAYEVDEPLPYSVPSDLFLQWVREDPAIVDLARDHQLLAALGRFVPDLAAREAPPERLSAQDERFRYLEAAAQLFRTAAREEPLLVVIEDAHWADWDSWSMLRYVARVMRERPVLFALVTRPDEHGGEPEGLSELARETDMRRVVLGPLDFDGATRMLESLVGERLPLAIVQTIYRESGGNPFYLRHLLEHLLEEGKLQRRHGRWSTDLGADELGIPRGVRSLLTTRIDRLSDGAVGMLRLASIYPDGFDVARLRILGDGPDDRLLDYLDESLDAGVIVAREGSYAFAHTLLRRTLHDAMNPDRRAQLHRRAAEKLAHSGDDPGEIARHYHASRRIPGADVGVAFALRAAERAADAHRHEHQADFLRIAVDLQGDQAGVDSLRDLALAQAAALDIDAAESTAQRLLERVRGARPEGGVYPPSMLDFLASLARRLKDAGAAPTVWRPFVELGLEACGEARDITWARLAILRPRWRCRWVGLVCETTHFPFDPVALDIVRRTGEEDDIAETLDPFEPRTKEETEAVRVLADRWRSAAAIIRARDVVARDWNFRHGDMLTAADRLRELARESERFGSLPGRAEAYTQLVWVELVLGRLSPSDDALREARSLTARLGPNHRLHVVLDVAVATAVAHCYGGWEPVREAARRALEGVIGQQAPIGVVLLANSAMAEAFSPGAGSYEERIEALLCSLERTDRGAYLANAALYFGVMAAHEREDVKRALRFAKLVREAQARGVCAGPFGESLEGQLGVLAALQGQGARARKHFAEARASLDRGGLQCLRAIIDFHDARVVGALGDVEGWRASIEQARRRFDMLGMAFWSARASRLEATGPAAAARNPHAPGPDGLSPREMEILGKLAAGGTAKTIASALGLGVATVNRHLANIYPKIGVNTRVAATAYALKHHIGQS